MGFTEVRKDFSLPVLLSASSNWSGSQTSGMEWGTVGSLVPQLLNSCVE